jgi:hypothetical protein
MHYSHTERDEPFWQHVKANYKPSERLTAIIENHINTDFLNTSMLFEDTKVFSPLNYALWLEQLGYTKCNPVKLSTPLNNTEVRNYLVYYADAVQATHHTSYPSVTTEVETYERYWQSPFKPEVIR